MTTSGTIFIFDLVQSKMKAVEEIKYDDPNAGSIPLQMKIA